VTLEDEDDDGRAPEDDGRALEGDGRAPEDDGRAPKRDGDDPFDDDFDLFDEEDEREVRPVSARAIKWSIALVVVAALAAAGTAIYVVLDNRDPVPADVLACVRDAGLPLNRSTASLNLARHDALSGRLVARRRWDWGRTSGALLQGPARDYAVLALWNADTPSLAAGDVGRRVYESPGRFPVVSAERPLRGRLVRCSERAG
jgi:hypothetical protein